MPQWFWDFTYNPAFGVFLGIVLIEGIRWLDRRFTSRSSSVSNIRLASIERRVDELEKNN